MKILVVGGTGGFGATICHELVKDGHTVDAGGRNQNKGERVAHAAGAKFIRIDRKAITMDRLASYDIVVDAAGPFQNQSDDMARAAIAAGVDHIDIADARDFVGRMQSLNADARSAGVRIVSGASSTPCLTSAVAIELSRGMESVNSVQIAISASSKAAFGRSVLLSMLGSAGQRIVRGDGTIGWGMGSPRALNVQDTNGRFLRRTVLEVETPDQDLIRDALPGAPAVRFRAGGELAIHNLSMRAIGAVVRNGKIANGRTFKTMADIARRMTSKIGSGRSAMEVVVTGTVRDRMIRRTWSMIADRNMGPLVPAMAVPAIVQAIEEGGIDPGAKAAIGIVGSASILSRMPRASIEVSEQDIDIKPIYATIMPDYCKLAPSIRAMHDIVGIKVTHGRASVIRGASIPARIIAWIFRFPDAAVDVPVTVEMERSGDAEIWTRTFGTSSFSSILSPCGLGVCERFGPFSFQFALIEKAGALRMEPASWSIFGTTLPSAWMPGGTAVESVEDGKFTFDVPIRAPVAGLIVHYRGWLE